jgi:hypothetical protein
MSVRAVYSVLLVFLALSSAVIPATAQARSSPLLCADEQTIESGIALGQNLVFLTFIIAIILAIIFHGLAIIASPFMRLGEALFDRFPLVLALVIIYLSALYGITPQHITSVGGCAEIDWQALLLNGPLLFRILGFVAKSLGMI